MGVISTTCREEEELAPPDYRFTLVSKRRNTHEIKRPIRRRPQRRPFGPHTERINLRRVKPRHALPSDAEKDVVEEEKRHGRRGDLLASGVAWQFVVPQQDGDAEIAKRLAGGGIHHQFPTAPFLDVGDADEAEQEIRDGVAGCEQPRELLVQPDGLDQHRG